MLASAYILNMGSYLGQNQSQKTSLHDQVKWKAKIRDSTRFYRYVRKRTCIDELRGWVDKTFELGDFRVISTVPVHLIHLCRET